jgi:hypothetical protein
MEALGLPSRNVNLALNSRLEQDSRFGRHVAVEAKWSIRSDPTLADLSIQRGPTLVERAPRQGGRSHSSDPRKVRLDLLLVAGPTSCCERGISPPREPKSRRIACEYGSKSRKRVIEGNGRGERVRVGGREPRQRALLLRAFSQSRIIMSEGAPVHLPMAGWAAIEVAGASYRARTALAGEAAPGRAPCAFAFGPKR